MDNNSIKENIERIRTEHHLSQAEMAKELGISRNAYRKLEKGETKLISDTVFKIADVLNVSPEEVLIGHSLSRSIDAKAEQYDASLNLLKMVYETKLDGLKREYDRLGEILKEKEDTACALEHYVELLKQAR